MPKLHEPPEITQFFSISFSTRSTLPSNLLQKRKEKKNCYRLYESENSFVVENDVFQVRSKVPTLVDPTWKTPDRC